ncbi:TPA: 50S ribosomal protein L21 [Candidatus Uhrbacteria bacterium]|uniref:Large ribosomal subunit protein bL21 n=1 Tax=Candidatus Uhrbacteria bacterium GW2011_GWC2_53_7 TaxID=1618986 RepID=A0A0G1XVE7_9BACT|nr:MAG: 50S ribosomal protein L21 [Parcubacteria group bacterium GW2011_GWA2_53_21]KKW35143.1 MAG: 50S ribosomal protein L21 [Candidatus Uhrbacteria bacterium GW2011_GWC2_53_7]OGL72514.1 MAG: 50S ribosomal protein L21 [Candidatus Uhrbacteria bacterium RIFCSPHIGHO2_02_FULL_54_11]HBL39847.1 50S ribosomal protein L21 [Candidatus Uhrbacteria bacterium]
MFAVIATGGKQYIIHEGEELKVEKLDLEEGGTIEFGAMLIADEEGTDVKVGTPNVDGAKVSATVVEQGRGKKITVIKYKPKVRYRRKYGHRQPFTKLKINKIVA